MSTGFFLVVEGPEGAGKTTLVASLAERMRLAGVDPIVVREPGGTPVGEAIRTELLDPGRELDARTELLYFTAARAALLHWVVRPALARGQVVLSDRFDLSTAAYQIGGRGLARDLVASLNEAATGGLRPDLVLVIDIPTGVGMARQAASGKGQDRFEREDEQFHRRVAEYYRGAQGEGIVHLDGTRVPEQVLRDAWTELTNRRPALFRGDRG